MTDEKQEDREIIKRLDAILSVLLEMVPAEGKKMSTSRRIESLHNAGLRPSEIARVLARHPSTLVWNLIV